MRATIFLLAASVLLAGCSGGGGGDADEGSGASPSATTTSTGPPPPPVPTTDTLHMLGAPTMTPDAALLGDEQRTPMGVPNFGQGQAAGATWSYQINANGSVAGVELHAWIEILETLFDPTPPNQPPCAWRAEIEVGADTPLEHCLTEPPGPIMAGIRELVFRPALQGNIGMEDGETVTIRLTRAGFSFSPSNAVDVLSGSTDHDSYIQLTGLTEPVDGR